MSRTVTKWMRFLVDDSGGTPREIPVDSVGATGFVYDEVDLTAYQDAVKGYLANHPEAAIEITGPLSNDAAAAAAASAAAPVLSGSHTILAPLSAPTFTTPLGLCVAWGFDGFWATGDPVFGVVAPSATSGYSLVKFQVEGEKFSASFKPFPGTTPAWGTALLT